LPEGALVEDGSPSKNGPVTTVTKRFVLVAGKFDPR
jgi:hypothetical protein